jgi:4-amino-4-deoxy-L-arabinose transferase-like glycosyltransferase
MPHVDGDALFFGEIARGILRSGDWLTLRHVQWPEWIVDKPPLTFWVTAIVFRVTGPTGWALRAWQVPFSIGLVAVTHQLARLGRPGPEGRGEALLAGLVLLTSLEGFYHTVSPQQDVALSFFVALAFVAYLRYRSEGGTGAAILTGVWLAAAVLSKGLAALAVFVPAVAADLLLPPRPPGAWRWSQVAAGAAAAALIGAPWFVEGALRLGRPFVDALFLSGIGIGRFFHAALRAPLPYWQAVVAYVPIAIVWMMPWTGLLPAAVGEGWRAVRAGPAAARLCALWAGCYFLILSISPGDKVFRYLLPLLPPLSVLIARAITGAMATPRTMRIFAALTLGLAVPALAAFAWLLSARYHEVAFYAPMAIPVAAALALTVAAFAVLAWQGRGRPAVAVLCAGMLLAYGTLEWTVSAHWERLWPWRAVAATITRLSRPGDEVIFRGHHGAETNALVFWLDRPVRLVDDDATVERLWRERRVFAVVSPESYAGLSTRLRPTVLIEMPVGWILATNFAP